MQCASTVAGPGIPAVARDRRLNKSSGAGMVAAAAGSLIDNWLGPRDEPIGVASDAGPFARPETHPRSPRAPPYLG